MIPSPLSSRVRTELLQWLRENGSSSDHELASGNQARVLLYKTGGYQLIIKLPLRQWPHRWLSLLMLRHEARVYRRLNGIEGIPHCYGLLEQRYLILEYIEGPCLRQDDIIRERDAYYSGLLRIIRRMHAAGVGHSDLRRKLNILIGPEQAPWVIDFGTAVIRKRGFHPLNHFLFNTARRFDLNAWVKHKYKRRPESASPHDKRYFKLTWIEKIARSLKRNYQRLFHNGASPPRHK